MDEYIDKYKQVIEKRTRMAKSRLERGECIFCGGRVVVIEDNTMSATAFCKSCPDTSVNESNLLYWKQGYQKKKAFLGYKVVFELPEDGFAESLLLSKRFKE